MNKVATFASLYTIVDDVQDKQNTIKVDRNILQRLMTAYRAERELNFNKSLQLQLMSIPQVFVSWRIDIGCTPVTTPTTVSLSLDGPSCLLIDSQALVMALQNPQIQKLWKTRLCKNISQYSVKDGDLV